MANYIIIKFHSKSSMGSPSGFYLENSFWGRNQECKFILDLDLKISNLIVSRIMLCSYVTIILYLCYYKQVSHVFLELLYMECAKFIGLQLIGAPTVVIS